MEKTADKWGKNGIGSEWQEKWWEHYDASGQADKWAHKWCCIDPNTPVEPGHAHVWHERYQEAQQMLLLLSYLSSLTFFCISSHSTSTLFTKRNTK